MGKILFTGGGGGVHSDELTATADKVLTGSTYVGADSNDEAKSGTMANRGAWTTTIGINGSVTIPEGYHSGAGKIKQSIPVQGGSTITPGTANKTAVAAGRYVNGNVIVAGSANLAAANIVNGVNIFGVVGTARKYATTQRNVVPATTKRNFNNLDGTVQSMYYVQINNIGFTPLYISLVGEFYSGTPLHVAYDGWGISYSYRNRGGGYAGTIYWFKKENVSATTIILPAGDTRNGGNLIFQAFGYY